MPNDVFTDEVSPALDEARTELSLLGLREYRCFLLDEFWDGGDLGVGTRSLTWEEITPYPLVSFNPRLIAAAGGSTEQGVILVSKISRRYTREELLGKMFNGQNLPRVMRQHWVIAPLRSLNGRSYAPAGEPSLQATEWRIPLRPTNEQFPLPSPDFTGLV